MTQAPDAAVAAADDERFRWPPGYRAAAALSFDVDAESAVLATHPQFARHLTTMSHQAYGPLVGVPRLLRILARQSVAATFFVPGFTAHRYPDVIRSIVDAGHEIGHHGYLHETPTSLTLAQERRALDRGLEALQDVAGVTPAGYRAPMWELSYRTPDLLVDRGFRYDSSLMDADRPYRLSAGPASARDTLVEIPVQWALDDWEQYAYIPGVSGTGYISTPTRVVELWRLELEAMHREGGCFVLTNHPFLSGRPSRAAALERFIETMTDLPDLWITTLSAIARHVTGLELPPRLHREPEVDDD